MNDQSQPKPWMKIILSFLLAAILVSVDFRSLVNVKHGNMDIIEKGHTQVLGIKQNQTQNYIDGTGLMLSVHVTHHGGTYFCSLMKQVGETPNFACMNGNSNEKQNKTSNWPVDDPIIGHLGWKPTSDPWKWNETALMVEVFRKYFHMISWEFGIRWGKLTSTNWHHPNLLSVVIMRDPLERFMAGRKCGKFFEAISNKDLAEEPSLNDLYWQYANDRCADNYALRVFTGSPHCCNGAETNITYLEQAKKQLDQFTILIDQTCETESILAMSKLLHFNLTLEDTSNRNRSAIVKARPSVRERLGNGTLYEYLLEKFKLDIELYEYAKSKSILDCSKLT
jgi:hypothetical protein